MTAANSPNRGFTSAEVETLVDYRPLNRVALAAVCWGLLSATALVHPLLWVVPAVTVVLALVALRSVANSAGEQRGGALALSALALGLLFGCWAVSWQLSHQFVLTRATQRHAEVWFDLLRNGRTYEAHQLTMRQEERLPPGESLEEAYTKRESEGKATAREPGKSDIYEAEREMELYKSLPSAFARFAADPPVDKLIEHGNNCQVRFAGNVNTARLNEDTREVAQRFTISYTEQGEQRSIQAVIVLERHCPGKDAYWCVSRISTAPGA